MLTVGVLDAAQSVTGAGRANDNEDEVAECPYLGDTITDESLEDVPTIDVPKGQTLTFIREVLVKDLLDEVPTSRIIVDDMLDQGDIESTIRTRVDGVLSQFFCNDEQACKCRDWNPETAKQVELWSFLARNSSERVYDDIIEKIISIISISASEASCERSFSPQKRIMGHSRVKSSPDLLKARLILKDGMKESNWPPILFWILILNCQKKPYKSGFNVFKRPLPMKSNRTPELEVQLIRSFR
jgi:hypothetical protein